MFTPEILPFFAEYCPRVSYSILHLLANLSLEALAKNLRRSRNFIRIPDVVKVNAIQIRIFFHEFDHESGPPDEDLQDGLGKAKSS